MAISMQDGVFSGLGGFYPDYIKMAEASELPLDGSKKVIIHMDVNQTIVFEDTVQGKSDKKVVQHGLAKGCVDVWQSSIVKKPMTYHDFVFNHRVPGPRSDKELKKERVKLVTSFVEYLEGKTSDLHKFYPEVHPYAKTARKTYERALDLLGRQTEKGLDILPSFYKLVEALEGSEIEYRIILRSFGQDTEMARDEIEKNTKLKFQRPTLEFQENRLIVQGQETLADEKKEKEIEAKDGLIDFYQYVKAGNLCAKDDWKWWNSHQEKFAFGKKFPVDTEDDEILSLFFDDNLFSADSSTNIVAPYEARTGKDLELASLFEKHQLVSVAPLEPLFNENYFINHIASALNPV